MTRFPIGSELMTAIFSYHPQMPCQLFPMILIVAKFNAVPRMCLIFHGAKSVDMSLIIVLGRLDRSPLQFPACAEIVKGFHSFLGDEIKLKSYHSACVRKYTSSLIHIPVILKCFRQFVFSIEQRSSFQ